MRVVWTRPALADLDRMQDHIAQDSPAAAFRFASAIAGRAELLAENPMLGRGGRVAGTRELVVAGTAYIVVYRIDAAVQILAVVHGARDWPQDFA